MSGPDHAFDTVPSPAASAAAAADPVALEILRGTSRMLVDIGLAPLAEVSLPNGRRADIVALGRDGAFTIVEIKSSLADFRSDQKWQEYLDFCDHFYFAVRPDFPREVLPEDAGMILADRYGADIVRPAAAKAPLSAARRKSLTLRVARLAAARLAAVLDPALKCRSEAKDF